MVAVPPQASLRKLTVAVWLPGAQLPSTLIVTAQVDDGERLPDQHKAKHDR